MLRDLKRKLVDKSIVVYDTITNNLNSQTIECITLTTNTLNAQNFNINDIGINQISYGNNTVQTSAYTGGTPGTYTNSNITIDANGKISAISSGSSGTSSTLAQVLLNGNSAGATSINMNSNNITGLNEITFLNNTKQTSAYTGGTTGNYTNVNLSIDSQGKISAISSGSSATSSTWAQVLLNGNSAGSTNINLNSNDIEGVNAITLATLASNNNQIKTVKRIYQQYVNSTNYKNVNGFYSLTQDTYPSLNPDSSGAEAVSVWTARAGAPNQHWESVCWSPERKMFVSVTWSGALGVSRSMYSFDGINWIVKATPANNVNAWKRVIWVKELGLFVAVSTTGTADFSMWWDGDINTNWTLGVTPSGNEWETLAWSPELNIMVSLGHSGVATSRVMHSFDGKTWIQGTTPGSAGVEWRGLCWAAELGLFVGVAVGTSGVGQRVITSPDGLVWTIRSTFNPDYFWRSVCWSKELGILLAISSDGKVMISSTGSNWVLFDTGFAQEWMRVIWIPELRLFVASAQSGTNRIMASSNGTSWKTYPTSDLNSWLGLCYSPELGILVSTAITTNAATINRVMTSNFAARPPTMYNVFNSNFNRIDQNGVWTFGNMNVNRMYMSTLSTTNTATSSIAIGDTSTLANITSTSSDNVAIGPGALQTLSTAQNNVAIGLNTLNRNNANSNIAIGKNAGQFMGGVGNTIIGDSACMGTNTLSNGQYNIAIGFLAMNGVTGNGPTNIANSNIVIGREALRYIEAGTGIISIGQNSLNVYRGTTGIASGVSVNSNNHIALGNNTLTVFQPTSGGANQAIGNASLGALVTGAFNVCNGNNTFFKITNNASQNTSMGHEAGRSFLGNSSTNTCIGFRSGYTADEAINYNATGNQNCTFIGAHTGIANGNASQVINNSTCLGVGAKCSASNQIVLGTSAETVIIPGTFSVANLSGTFPPTSPAAIGWTDQNITVGNAITLDINVIKNLYELNLGPGIYLTQWSVRITQSTGSRQNIQQLDKGVNFKSNPLQFDTFSPSNFNATFQRLTNTQNHVVSIASGEEAIFSFFDVVYNYTGTTQAVVWMMRAAQAGNANFTAQVRTINVTRLL